ncbi:MAG: hypothetical protein FJ030_19145 [Chloroflexi bacterium]|nr:hypothetical protein [Chloroflexota bacterium]
MATQFRDLSRYRNLMIAAALLVLAVSLAACTPAKGKCGDGVCDSFEQKKPGFCPVDCNATVGENQPDESSATTAITAGGNYAFHINYAIDWQVTCNGVCDAAFIPNQMLYLRGDFSIQPDQSVSGDGILRVIYMEQCQTLMPSNSKCAIGTPADGHFSISGKTSGKKAGDSAETVELTLTLDQLPTLPLTHTVLIPPTEISMDNTTQMLFDGLLKNSGIFNTPLILLATPISGELSQEQTSRAGSYFESDYEFSTVDRAMVHSLHSEGGLLFINPQTALPVIEQ